jgi:hypothetical protein
VIFFTVVVAGFKCTSLIYILYTYILQASVVGVDIRKKIARSYVPTGFPSDVCMYYTIVYGKRQGRSPHKKHGCEEEKMEKFKIKTKARFRCEMIKKYKKQSVVGVLGNFLSIPYLH